MLPALWFAIPAAVFAFGRLTGALAFLTGGPWRGVVATASLCTVLASIAYPLFAPRVSRFVRAVPFEIGLGPDREAIVEALRTATTSEARILWEESAGGPQTSRWAALLPVLTERAFVGGLGPDMCIEHGYAGLVAQKLAGRPITEWKDAELEHFFRRLQHRLGSLPVACRDQSASSMEVRGITRRTGGWNFGRVV